MPNQQHYLNYLQLIKYIIKNINTIHCVNDVIAEFGESIKEVTKERMERPEFLLFSNRLLGQKAYFFSFEDSGFIGEFSLDFLPEDYHANFKSILLSEGHLSEDFLANFRGMLLSEDSNAIEKEYKRIFEFFKNEYGPPNNEEAAIMKRDINAIGPIVSALIKERVKFLDIWNIVTNGFVAPIIVI